MGILNKVLVGIGSYLVKKGELDAQAARDQILFNREVALKQVESQIADKNSERDHQERIAEIQTTGAENRRTDLMQGIIADRRDATKAQRDLQHDITIKKIDFSNDANLEGLKHKYKLSEDQYSSMLDGVKTARDNNQTVDRVVFSKNGQLQLVMKNGDIVSKGPAGGYNPSGADASDLGDYLNTGGTASGSSISRTAPQGVAPTPQASPNKAAALAALGTAYTEATQNPNGVRQRYPGMFDPSGKLLPKQTLLDRVNQSYGN